MTEDILYDTVIIGGGPAGLAAGLYASRARLKTALLEKAWAGGQVMITDLIENYPGFPGGVRGPELIERMAAQAKEAGLELTTADAAQLVVEKEIIKVIINNHSGLRSRSVIMATGARWNALGVPGEAELVGRGVSYCATCDGPLFKGKEVVVVGGGDTAVGDALFLTKFAKKVTLVHRRDALRATKVLQERLLSNPAVEVRWDSVVTRINGSAKTEGAVLKNVKTLAESTIRCDGVFVFVGIRPNSEIVKDIVELDGSGHIITDADMATSVKNIFACGDVRKKALKQIVTAVGEGAAAAFSAQHYVENAAH